MEQALYVLVITTALLLGSPGPAPLALAATAATFGTRNSLGFLSGILSALVLVIVIAALGSFALLNIHPMITLTMQLLAASYLIFIAWKIAMAPLGANAQSQHDTPGWQHGFMLNMLNPKAYAAFFALLTQFTLPLENQYIGLFVTGLICWLVAVVVDFAWLIAGGLIGSKVGTGTAARIVRVVFAIAMLVTVLLAFI